MKIEITMRMSFFYYAGLILTIMGLIGVISETGEVWSRYLVLSLGLIFLLIGYFKRPRKTK